MPHPDEILGLAVNRRGNWTPVDNSGAGLALTVDSANWVAHSRLIIARARISYPVTANGAGADIAGLPFQLLAPDANRQGFISYSTVAALRYVLPVPTSSAVRFYDSAGAQITNAQMSGGTFIFTCMYDAN